MNTGVPPPRGRRRLAAVLLVGMVVALEAGGWTWRAAPASPPLPDLAEIDPEAAQAIRLAHRRVRAAPHAAAAWGRLGQVLRAHDFGTEANACFAEAERLDPHQPRWPYLQGLTLLLTDPDAGIRCLERAVARCGDDPPAPRLRLAEALLEQGRLAEAEERLRAARAHDPDGPRVHLGLARLHLARGQWPAALDHLDRCAEDEHARKLALTLRAGVARRLRQPGRAAAALRRIAALPDDEPWPDPYVAEVEALQVGLQVRLARAEARMRRGEVEEALTLLHDTVARRPEAAPAWLQLGRSLLQVKRSREAARALEQAVRLAPGAAEGWFQLGCARAFLGEPRDAADCFRRAVARKPDHTLAHYNLGLCLRQFGDRAGAADAFRQALRCQPDHAPARVALAALAPD